MVYDLTGIKDRTNDKHCLAEISEFGALLQKAIENRVPVFALTKEQIKETGLVLRQMEQSRDRFKSIFESIGSIILELVK